MHHSSTSTDISNVIEIEETFCGRMDGRTDGHLRPTLLGQLGQLSLNILFPMIYGAFFVSNNIKLRCQFLFLSISKELQLSILLQSTDNLLLQTMVSLFTLSTAGLPSYHISNAGDNPMPSRHSVMFSTADLHAG